jgi:hypothetical protein
MNEIELPYLYWIPKLHKTPCRHGCMAGSGECSTGPLSLLLAGMLRAVGEGLQTYCATTYAGGGVGRMWILKDSKDLLANFGAQNFSKVSGIESYGFSTLCTTIPQDGLEFRLLDIIDNCFFFFGRGGGGKCACLVVGRRGRYFIKHHSDSMHKYSAVEIKKMLEFLMDNVCVVVGGLAAKS